MKRKNILLTGGTSGIGNEYAWQLIREGHTVYMIARNPEKIRQFEGYPNAHAAIRDLANNKDIYEYLEEMKQRGIVFDYVLPFAGDLRKDHTFDSVQASIKYHMDTNVLTTQTVVSGLVKIYGDALQNTSLLIMSSWAAHFSADNPFRVDEEGYVQSKAALSGFGRMVRKDATFKQVIIEEPQLVDSPLTQREFGELMVDESVPKLSTTEYIKAVREKIGL